MNFSPKHRPRRCPYCPPPSVRHMSERDELLSNLRQVLELERASGVEFVYPLPGERSLTTRAPASTRLQEQDARGSSYSTIPSVALPSASSSASSSERIASPPIITTTPQVSVPGPSAVQAPPDLQLTGLAATDLATIATQIAACTRCGLCQTRGKTVPGEGHPSPELVFVGEGPGAEEDEQGRPFVGAAGSLLSKMITAMGLRREDVFITNVVKCRPPGNRTPEAHEVTTCMPFLAAQVHALKPRLICTLGNTPLRAFMQDDKLGIVKMRGQKLHWQGIPLIPTFHPSYLLRNPSAKKPCWEDLVSVLKELGRTPPPRSATST